MSRLVGFHHRWRYGPKPLSSFLPVELTCLTIDRECHVFVLVDPYIRWRYWSYAPRFRLPNGCVWRRALYYEEMHLTLFRGRTIQIQRCARGGSHVRSFRYVLGPRCPFSICTEEVLVGIVCEQREVDGSVTGRGFRLLMSP